MTMLRALNSIAKHTPLARPLIFAKSFVAKPKSQNAEVEVLARLLARYDVPRRFVEFGFSGWEFNCAGLIKDWQGLLIDGDSYNVTIARTILSKRIQSYHCWITLENIQIVREYASHGAIGVLSIDVDGNDYWFLEALIDLKPAIIISEYNSSFGLVPVTVPYDPAFDRREKHPSGTYYGASLSALTHLAQTNGYSLIEVEQSGVNAFFLRSDLLAPADIPLKPEQAFRAKQFSDGSTSNDKWARICHLPFIDVVTGSASLPSGLEMPVLDGPTDEPGDVQGTGRAVEGRPTR